jgi:Protein of unknown function (DUF1217)
MLSGDSHAEVFRRRFGGRVVDIGINSNSAAIALSLFGASATPTSTPTMGALAGLKPYVTNEPQKIADYEQQSGYKQDVAYFKAHIGKVKSVDDLVKDPKLLKIMLGAFNLQSDAQYPAKVKAILNSNLNDRASYANSLIDPRYQQFAQEFNVYTNKMSAFSNSTTINDVISKYTTNSYEASLDSVNPALRSAAYFLRNVGSITDAYNILGDTVLRNVVLTALNLPQTVANLPVEDQRRLIMSKIDITKLEVKGGSGSSGGTSATSAALDQANQDASAILNDRNIVGAAETSVQTVDERIVALQKSYQQLANIQNPSGPFAAEIPVQQAAAPVLVQQQALLNTAQAATGSITSALSQMQTLMQQVGSSTNTTPLADMKAQFQTLHDQIVSAISGATYQFDNGTGGATYTTQNLLDGSMSASISVQYDAKGDTVTVRPQDMGANSNFRAQLDAANQTFQNIIGAFDGNTIKTASTALSSAQTANTFVTQSMGNDVRNFSAAIASVKQWAGTYDTSQLYRGSQSLVDAGSRMTQINQILTQIQTVANQSSQMSPTADRTSVQSQYNDLITQLGKLINTPGQSNLDNLLNANPSASTPGYYSYGIDAGNSYTIQARAQDLVSSVLNPLSGADITSAANANAVLAMVKGGSVQTAVSNAGQQIGLDSQNFALAANTIDPRSAVDSQYRKLATDMTGLVSNADWLGTNLLDSKQAPLSLSVPTAGMNINIAPQNTYDTDVTQALNAGSQKLPSDPTDTSGALAALENARFNNARALSTIRQQINQLDLAKNITATHITQINQQQANSPTITPINATPLAQQIVQKYLSAADASNPVGGSSNSYVLQLMQGASGSSLDQTIASIGSMNLNISV